MNDDTLLRVIRVALAFALTVGGFTYLRWRWKTIGTYVFRNWHTFLGLALQTVVVSWLVLLGGLMILTIR